LRGSCLHEMREAGVEAAPFFSDVKALMT
jgi:hypothetical protein